MAESNAPPGRVHVPIEISRMARIVLGAAAERVFPLFGPIREAEWAAETRTTLAQKSPTSLKVTLKQLTEYGEHGFEEAMALEYRLAMHCNLGVDFFEGIRAQIVDKDRNPAWRPARLEEVTAQAVDAYFEEPPRGDMEFW